MTMPLSASLFVRTARSLLLWTLTVIGVAGGALWAANVGGFVQPLIVMSGSMEPGIATGDLIFATPTPATEVSVGEVATLPSALEDTLVTHRVTSITESGDSVAFEMKGDANAASDAEIYMVSADADVWQPVLVVPGAGRIVMDLMQPTVAVPLAVGVLALMMLAMMPLRSELAGTDAAETDTADGAARDAASQDAATHDPATRSGTANDAVVREGVPS